MSKKRWTKDEDDYLRRFYLSYGADHCAEDLGRTPAACMIRAGKLGCNGRRPGHRGDHPLCFLTEDMVSPVVEQAENLSAAADILGVAVPTLRAFLLRRPHLRNPARAYVHRA